EYREICRAVAALGHLSPRTSDVLVSRGERVAAAVVAATITAAGRPAVRVDALDVVATDGRHGGAAPDIAVTRRRARQALPPLLRKGVTPIVPGFFGRAPDGTVATLGAGLFVSTIFQASSEISIGFTLPEVEATRAVAALRRAFEDEIHSGLIDGVTARLGVGVVAVVGEGMAGTPGIAARVFAAL